MSQHVPAEAVIRYSVEAEICGRTDVGPTRSENQDAIMVATVVGTASGTRLSWSGIVPESGVPVAVIDGMGGHAGGGDAAALAAISLATVALDKDSSGWDAWFEALSSRIAAAGEAWGTPDMGATAVLVGITSGGLVIANVGDCRVYRVVGEYLGQLSVDDRPDDPDSSSVTQALGGSTRLDAHLWLQPYQGGPERLVLCSDGVWDTLDPTELREFCGADSSPGYIVDAIAEAIYERRGNDNASIVVIDLTATPAQNECSHEQALDLAWSLAAEVAPLGEKSDG